MQPHIRSQSEEHVLSIVGWHGRLNEASTHTDVLRLAREFLARLAPADVALLPEECRPGKLVDSADISDYALALVQRSCAGDRLADATLQRVAAFFTRASLRLAQITAQATEVSSEER
jgi:hypothetical protein